MFKTENGRKVYDGGGVMPDVEIEKPKTLKLTKNLYESDAFFNFVTDYYYQHKTIAAADQFTIDTSVYDALKTYLLAHNKDYEITSDQEFEKAFELTKKDGYQEAVQKQYVLFREAIAKEKIQQLDVNKIEIIEQLTEEIAKRYYFKEGVYQQKLAFDPTIVQATELLYDTKKYAKLLK